MAQTCITSSEGVKAGDVLLERGNGAALVHHSSNEDGMAEGDGLGGGGQHAAALSKWNPVRGLVATLKTNLLAVQV